MRTSILTAAMLALAVPTAIHAEAAPKFSTATSTIADLVANPDAKAVLAKYMPPIIDAAPQIGTMTLKGLQSMAPDKITDDLLAKVDADLAKIK
jgi:hypothetical protein